MGHLIWISEEGRRKQIVISEKEFALLELGKISRKLHRAITPKKIYRPLLKNVQYLEPTSPIVKHLGGYCKTCGRLCWGQKCRECWNKIQWNIYNAKRKADDERVRLFNQCFTTVVNRMEIKMAKGKQLPATPIHRSTAGLRTALFEEMEALRTGTSNPARARSVAMMANSILQSVQVEIEYHKYVKSNGGNVTGDKKVVELGTTIALGEQAA